MSDEPYITQKPLEQKTPRQTNTLARKFIEATDTVEIGSVVESVDTSEHSNSHLTEASPVLNSIEPRITIPMSLSYTSSATSIETQKTLGMATQAITDRSVPPPQPKLSSSPSPISPRYALLFIALLCILVFQTLSSGPSQFIGAQGWAYVLGGPNSAGDPNILKGIGKQPSKTGTPVQGAPKMTPEQYVNLVVQKMSLDQKLGQMMIVQFVGPAYSLDLSTMVKQYNVGSVLIFAANQNIISKDQLKGLIGQMQADSPIPLAVAIDQEGGYVDRLAALDGTRPAESDIGATGDSNVARQAGLRDAQDLSY